MAKIGARVGFEGDGPSKGTVIDTHTPDRTDLDDTIEFWHKPAVKIAGDDDKIYWRHVDQVVVL